MRGGNATDEPGLDMPPTPIRIVPAAYTAEARNAGFHAKISVTVFVDAAGMPEKMESATPLPFGLDRPVLLAIMQWRFRPARSRDGAAVEGKAVVDVPFR